MTGQPEDDKPISHRTTSALLATGFGLLTLALLGKAMVAESDTSRFNLALATVVLAWAGLAAFLIHRRWVKSLERDR